MTNQALSPSTDEKGFILVVVLGVCALMAVLGAGFAATLRGELRSTAAALNVAQANGISEAGIALALLDLRSAANRPSARRYPIDATAIACRFDDSGASLVVQIEDEGGKVNLRSPNQDLLQSLFAGLGALPEQARVMANYLKRETPLTIEDLNRVPGMTAALQKQAVRMTTLYSATAGVDPELSSPELRVILASGRDVMSGSVVVRSDRTGGEAELPPQFISRSANMAVNVRSLGQLANGTRVISEAIIVKQNGALIVKQWRRGELRGPQDGILKAQIAERPC